MSKHIVFGIHPVREALLAGRWMDKIWYRKGRSDDRLQEILTLARDRAVPVQAVPDIKLDKVARDQGHQGVVAMLAPIGFQELEPLLLQAQDDGKAPLLLMLDGITDVRNFGAISRTAEALGVDAIIIPQQGSASVNGDALKTSAGALHHIPICRVRNLVDALMLMQAYDLKVVGCTEKTEASIFDADLSGPLAIIMGAEDKGISGPLLKRADELMSIPMRGKVSSLNVSVATAIITSEAIRQRKLS